MNITVLGATGMAGAAIAQEATRRGHHVTAVSRNPQETNCPASSSWQDFLGFECRGGGVGQAQVHLLGPVP